MNEPARLDRYQVDQPYAWNYEHAPSPVQLDVPPWPTPCTFLGRPVGSPLGVAAGPLLNGPWVLYYAALGFDVLTYKTVRSVERGCFPLPNLLSVECEQVDGRETSLRVAQSMRGTWAVSFGMPSKAPDVWRADVEWTRRQLRKDKLLSVSLVATQQSHWTIDDLAADYAQLARWALDAGADCIETNFSCPNVSTVDGDLYRHPGDAGLCAQRVREAIGATPYIIKVGHLKSDAEAAALVEVVAPWCDALATTNSVALPVRDAHDQRLFDGQRRGICGAGIREASIAQTAQLTKLISERGLSTQVIGVGGAFTAADVRRYLHVGATAVHLATAAMVEPSVAISIRRDMASGMGVD